MCATWYLAFVRIGSSSYVAVSSRVDEASEALKHLRQPSSIVFDYSYVDAGAVLDFIEHEVPSARLTRVDEHYATMESFSLDERLKVLAHITSLYEGVFTDRLCDLPRNLRWHFAVVERRSPPSYEAVCSPVDDVDDEVVSSDAVVFAYSYVDAEAVLDFIENEVPSARRLDVASATMQSFSVEERLKVLAHVAGMYEGELAVHRLSSL